MFLLTSPELSSLRALLKQSLLNAAGRDLFVSLYASWCHSPMEAISLCLLVEVLHCIHCICTNSLSVGCSIGRGDSFSLSCTSFLSSFVCDYM